MQWQEICAHYPRQWLLVEAIKAHSDAGKRILEQLAVISTFSDSVTAMKSYSQLHREAPQRELYVFHTSRETLEVTERRWLGIHPAGSAIHWAKIVNANVQVCLPADCKRKSG